MKYQITVNFTTKKGNQSQTSTTVNGQKAANNHIKTTTQWLEARGDIITSTSITSIN